jgi:hypothetical protein
MWMTEQREREREREKTTMVLDPYKDFTMGTEKTAGDANKQKT